MPKSVTLTVPSGRTMTLPGLTSRCTTPARWAPQGGADLLGDAHGVAGGEPAVLADQVGEVPALGILHDDEVGGAVDAVVVDLRDVRVGERGGRSGLAAEALDEVAGLGERRGEHLDGDLSTEARRRSRGTPHPCRRQRCARPACSAARCGRRGRSRRTWATTVGKRPPWANRSGPRRRPADGRRPTAGQGGGARAPAVAGPGRPDEPPGRVGPRRPCVLGSGLLAAEGREHDDERRDLLGRRVARHGQRGVRCAHAELRSGRSKLLRRGSAGHSGMFPCFLGGSVSRLFCSARRARVTFIRVLDGLMTVSM